MSEEVYSSQAEMPVEEAPKVEKLTEEEWYNRHVALHTPARKPGDPVIVSTDNGPGFTADSEMPLYARTKSRLSNPEKHRRSQLYARLTYVAIIFAFLGVCATAVIVTMQTESHKTGFRAIHVKKPISFFDYTYVDKNKKPNQ